jgi:hypothetical protein
MDREERYKIVVERAKEIRTISEQYDKRSLEYGKASVEFSKLLVTNLHLINAGGLLATPTLAKFVGYEVMRAKVQTLVLTLPPVLFLLGLISAAVCALATSRNFHKHAPAAVLDKEEQIAAARTHFPLLPDEEPYTAYEQDKHLIDEARKKNNRSIQRTYFTGLGSGTLSIIFFAAGCGVYGIALLLPVLESWRQAPT